MTEIECEIRDGIEAARAIDPRNRTAEQHKLIRDMIHIPALQKHYESHGVGDTTKHKLAFWESTCPDGYSISHNPSDEQRVAVFESCWIDDNYPQDAIFC
jgi:hypothetical protein